MNGEAVHASPRKTGIIILGGGLPKHHLCNANLMGVILELILTRLCRGGNYEVLLKLLRYGLISPNSSFVCAISGFFLSIPLADPTVSHEHHSSVLFQCVKNFEILLQFFLV